jgi:hypothetical protein
MPGEQPGTSYEHQRSMSKKAIRRKGADKINNIACHRTEYRCAKRHAKAAFFIHHEEYVGKEVTYEIETETSHC